MISYAEALHIIRQSVEPLPAAEIALAGLAGSVAAAAAQSRHAVPGFANAAMDGFAVRGTDTHGASVDAPLELPVTGRIGAGHSAQSVTTRGAIEIMTGAPMPGDCDAVVPIERAVRQAGADGEVLSILLDQAIPPGANVRQSGEDFEPGAAVISPGELIEPHRVMALAVTGHDRLAAHKTPRAAVLVTGDELTRDGVPGQAGLIRDANGPYLAAALGALGARVTGQDSAADAETDIARRIDALAADADLVIATGGVSAGRYDLVPAALNAVGAEILFHRVAIRPGKPLLFARLAGGAWFIGLPGNPIAVAVGARFFVAALIDALQGRDIERFHPARSRGRIGKRAELTFFGKALASVNRDGRLEVGLLPGQQSFMVAPLLDANCWVIVPEGCDSVAPGEMVDIAPLYPTGFLQTSGR